MRNKPIVYVITGPTASGKSALSIELASRLQTEIISADSRQIYKGIPVSTAVVPEKERKGIPHHFLEILDLEAYYSASRFESEAIEKISSLLEDKGSAVVCGGSMLYVDALCNGIDEIPTVPEEIRNSLYTEWKEKGDDFLTGMLKNLDPDYWGKVDLKNIKRVFHAVEVSLTAGVAYSSLLNKNKKPRPFPIVKIEMAGDRTKLFERINGRVDKMVACGLEEEAQRVFPIRHLNSLNTVGLKEMFMYFTGLLTFDQAVERIKKNTRVYAKKQVTWYKKDPTIVRFNFEEGISENVEKILSLRKGAF